MGKAKTSTFIWTMPLEYNAQEKQNLDVLFRNACQIYNALTADRIRAKNNLEHQKAYKDIRANIASVGKRLNELEEEKKNAKDSHDKEGEEKAKQEIKDLKNEQKDLYNKRRDMIVAAGMTEYSFMARVIKFRNHFKTVIPSKIATGVASQVWKKFNLYFFGDKSKRKVKKIHFKPVTQFKSIESGVFNSAIVFSRIGDNEPEEIREKYFGRIRVGHYVNNLMVPVPKTARDEEALIGNRIKYIRIIRIPMKSGVVYKAQFVMEGLSPLKINREDGEVIYPLGKGKVGIDIGLKIVAVSTENTVRLYELAPNSDNPEKEAARLQRAMDRSRRANNPWFFDPETGVQLKLSECPEDHVQVINGRKKRIWVNSKNYLALQRRYRYIMAKAARIRKMEQEILANEILTLGDEFYIENVDFSKFAQKKPQQKKEDLKPGEKFKSRKNAGKTIGNRAPAQFVSILKNKVLRQGGTFVEVDPVSTKVTMYNHVLDDYRPQSLAQRWDKMPNGDKVQRNMYNAFLLQHMETTKDKVKINRDECLNDFDKFYRMELEEVNRLQHVKMPSSSGIKYVGPKEEK